MEHTLISKVENEYPQSSRSVDSMLETRPISACAKLKPVEQMKSEISSVELIAELVEVELQKVPLDVMVRGTCQEYSSLHC